MRIVFIDVNPFPRYVGGMENWLFNFLFLLRKDRIDLVVVSPISAAPVVYEVDKISDLKIFNIGSLTCLARNTVLRKIELLFRYFLWFIKTTLLILKLEQEKNRVNIYIGLHTIPGSFPLALARFFNRDIKAVVYARGRVGKDLLEAGKPFLSMLYVLLEKFVLSFSGLVIANGYDTAVYIEQMSEKKVYVLKNGVNCQRFSEPCLVTDDLVLYSIRKLKNDGKKIIICVGTIRPVKGVGYVIDAVASLKKRLNLEFENLCIVFVGKGDPEIYIQQATRLGIDKDVQFLGQTLNVPQVLALADIAVAVSGGGGFSQAAIEIMAAGLPIVAWDSDTYRQLIVNGETGHLVHEFDSDALAEGIVTLLNDPQYAQNIANNAAAEAATYDWSLIVPEFMSLLNEIN